MCQLCDIKRAITSDLLLMIDEDVSAMSGDVDEGDSGSWV